MRDERAQMLSPLLYLDPRVLSVVGPSTTVTLRRVGILKALGELSRRHRIRPGTVDGVLEAMYADGMFPYAAHIRSQLTRAGVDYISADAVAALVYGLLDRAVTVEECMKVKDLLSDHLQVDPPIASDGPGELGLAWRRLLERLAIGLSHACVTSNVVVTASASEGFESHVVSGVLQLVETASTASDEKVCPCAFSSEIRLTLSVAQAIIASDPVSHACTSADAETLGLAVYMQALRMATELGAGAELAGRFDIGPEFVSSAFQLGFFNQPVLVERLLRACAEVLLGLNLDKTHDIRKTSAANSPAMKSHGATALRRDIDHEYHLHYWSPTSNGLEFAAVVPHRSLRIPGLAKA